MGFLEKNITGIIIGSIGLILLIMSNRKTLHVIKQGQQIRNDAMGSGIFGASRSGGTRQHKGIDILFAPGENVLAPITGKITRLAIPYANDPNYSGIEMKNDDFRIIMFYINPLFAAGSAVAAGQVIAKAQNIAAKHGGGMLNHVHIEVYDNRGILVDPEKLF